MIKKGYVFLMIGLQVILCAFKADEGGTEMEQIENKFCDISEFTDLDYYLLCDTVIITGPSDCETKRAILGNDVGKIEAGEQLYQKIQKQYIINEKSKNSYISRISPDCKWVITKEDVSEEYGDYMTRWSAFHEKKKITETVKEDISEIEPVIVVNNGESYAVMEKQINKNLMELNHDLYFKGYFNPVINEQGDLVAVEGMRKNNKLVSIWNINDGTEIWSFSNENMQGNSFIGALQFWGDEKEGKVIMRIDDRDFYEISYPSGDMKYIGQDMYSLCYSPDRKYVAYSNCDNEDYYDFDEKNYDEVSAMPKGIYILEVETGKIAYIEQDSELSYQCRRFQWIEKESFNKIIKKDVVQMEEKP